eukprot:tig00000459_g1100.t1
MSSAKSRRQLEEEEAAKQDAAAKRIQQAWGRLRLRRALFRRALEMAAAGRGSTAPAYALDALQRKKVGTGWLGLLGRIEGEFHKVAEKRPGIMKDIKSVKELTWGEPTTVGEALQRIFVLSGNQFARPSLVHAGAVPMLMGVLKKQQKSGPGRLRAFSTLANLVDECPEGAMSLAEIATPLEIRTMIGATDDVEEDKTGYRILSGAAACKAVNVKWTATLGLLDIVLTDLKDPYRKNAYSIGPAVCLAACCSFPENHRAIEAAGGLPVVKDLCKHPLVDLKLQGLACVIGLQNAVELRRRLLEMGYMKSLIPLLASSGAVKRDALRVLSRFSPLTASHEELLKHLTALADAAHDPIEDDPAAKEGRGGEKSGRSRCAAICLANLVSSPVCKDRPEVQRAGRLLMVYTDPAYARSQDEEERELFEVATRAVFPERARELLKNALAHWGGLRLVRPAPAPRPP